MHAHFLGLPPGQIDFEAAAIAIIVVAIIVIIVLLVVACVLCGCCIAHIHVIADCTWLSDAGITFYHNTGTPHQSYSIIIPLQLKHV